MSRLFSNFFSPFLLLLLVSTAQASPAPGKRKEIDLEKISSLFPHHDSDVICLSTAENPFLIGMVHQVPIHSAIEKVVAVFEDFESYPKIFKDLKKVKILEKKDSREFLVEYESIIPIPFVPNSIYKLLYVSKVVEQPQFQKQYHFDLKDGGRDLKSMHGVAIIKKLGPTETLYQEVDFIEPDLGIAKSFAAKSIWIDTVTGSFESDFGLKLKSENPSMASKEVLKQSRFSVESSKIKSCLEHKRDAGVLFETGK